MLVCVAMVSEGAGGQAVCVCVCDGRGDNSRGRGGVNYLLTRFICSVMNQHGPLKVMVR